MLEQATVIRLAGQRTMPQTRLTILLSGMIAGDPHQGGATWERKAVILPTTKPGEVSSKLKFKILVCDKDNCLPPKTLDLEAILKVAGDPVAVDPKYKAEVEKALKKSP